MMSPRPPPPAIAAIGAVATTVTAAIRIPVKSSGIASGSSTRARICGPVMPIPRAASTTSRSTRSMPSNAFVSIGPVASTASATMLFTKPMPSTVRNAADQDEARERAADDRRADREPRAAMEVAERDAERQRDDGRDRERRAAPARAARAPSSASRPGLSPMKLERVGERAPVGDDHANLSRAHGTSSAAEQDEQPRRRRARARSRARRPSRSPS